MHTTQSHTHTEKSSPNSHDGPFLTHTDTQTELSCYTCKRKHNFSHFEIAVWQLAITLQIPGRRGNHGNSFQNTPAAHGEKEGSFRSLLCMLPFLCCQWSGTPDAGRDTFTDAPVEPRGPLSLSVPPQFTGFLPHSH